VRSCVIAVLFLLALTAAPGSRAQTPASVPPAAAREKVIIDTDIGDDIDDAFAIALALKSPELEILGISTTFGDTEARAKIVYERLINFTDDTDTIRALQFLMTREITHMKAFTAALESLGKDRFSIGSLPPTPELVNQYFDDSTGTGDRGEPNARGPWNTGGDWHIVEAPAFKEFESQAKGTRQPKGDGVLSLKAAAGKK